MAYRKEIYNGTNKKRRSTKKNYTNMKYIDKVGDFKLKINGRNHIIIKQEEFLDKTKIKKNGSDK